MDISRRWVLASIVAVVVLIVVLTIALEMGRPPVINAIGA